MKDWTLRFYHRLPAPARSAVASLRGYQLRSWRYGPESERLVAEILERESWTKAQWAAWRDERLSYILRRAAIEVPYYRELWAERRRQGDRSSWEYLENWPILEKESLRQNASAFVADDCDRRQLFHVQTSGTSGKSLNLWHGKPSARLWYALFEARCRNWNAVSRHDRWAIIGGQLVTPANHRRPPFWVWNAALNQLYMSSYHLAPDLVPHYFDALRRYKIKYLFGYTSSLYTLAQEALRLGRTDLKMTVCITNAEPVFEKQRRVIEEAFQCPVREKYGMAEMVAAASECRAGTLHWWPEVSQIEIMNGGQPVLPGASGDLIATGLLNAEMPIIRYRVGDRVALPVAESHCECERALPHLAYVEGRVDDVLYTSDGRRVGRLDPVFKADLPVREAQIIQEALNRVRVRYVGASGFSGETSQTIIRRLQERMGKIEVVLEAVEEVPRGANGKFRAVVCNLPSEVKESLRQQIV